MGIRWYIAKRFINAIPVMLSVIVIAFFLVRLAPGDPAVMMAGEAATPQYVELMREKYGLNEPLLTQLRIQITKMFTGDWGVSYTYNRPVLTVIFERLPQTLLLVGVGLTAAIILGVLLGISAARKPYSAKDNLITFGSLAGFSLPVFWIAQILILVFAIRFRIFPIGGIYDIGVRPISGLFWGWGFTSNVIKHLIMPATALTTFFMATYTRLTRTGLLEVQRMNFMLAAKAKGVPEAQLFRLHGLRNALLPIITVAGIQFGLMVSGVVLTSTSKTLRNNMETQKTDKSVRNYLPDDYKVEPEKGQLFEQCVALVNEVAELKVALDVSVRAAMGAESCLKSWKEEEGRDAEMLDWLLNSEDLAFSDGSWFDRHVDRRLTRENITKRMEAEELEDHGGFMD